MTTPATAYAALGSNLDDPRRQLGKAREAIACIPNTQLLRASADYRSAPLGPQDQPDYVNAVVALSTTLDAETLLTALQRIEDDQGRQREVRWGPRTLDLDLLLYDDLVQHSDVLTLPHPEMHRRAFVLVPLAEIAPLLAVPGQGPLADLIDDAMRADVQRLADLPHG